MSNTQYEHAMVNLNAMFKNKKPNVLGREKEVEMICESLLRIRKPNVILKGEPGVGKTALVNYMAYKIANNEVPEEMQNYVVWELNLNSLLAGDGYRGVFEKKVDNLIKDVMNKGNVILFIDEFHGAENLGKMGGGQTTGLGNTLKPYLARGDIKVIGATTNTEYDDITDKALLRRFMTVNVNEPCEEVVKDIIGACIDEFNTRDLKIVDREKIVNHIYDISQQLSTSSNPDKAVNVVDFLFARSKMRNFKEINPDNAYDCANDMLKLERRR